MVINRRTDVGLPFRDPLNPLVSIYLPRERYGLTICTMFYPVSLHRAYKCIISLPLVCTVVPKGSPCGLLALGEMAVRVRPRSDVWVVASSPGKGNRWLANTVGCSVLVWLCPSHSSQNNLQPLCTKSSVVVRRQD